MLIIDAHLDIAWNAVQIQRDVTLSAHDMRRQESGRDEPNCGVATVGLPDLRRGRVAVVVGTVFGRCSGQPVRNVDFHTPQHCHAICWGQVEYYRALDRAQRIKLITTAESLQRHMATWRRWEAAGATGERPLTGVIISLEGVDPVIDPQELHAWHDAGVRLVGLAHYGRGRYAGGTGSSHALTDRGRELLEVMGECGMALDVSHTSDASFDEATARFSGRMFASHNNCRVLVPHQRQLADDQIQTLIDRDGVIGTAFDCWMLRADWSKPDGNAGVTLEHVANHIDHICQLAGNSRHAAIGSDLDGGFGQEQSPADVDTIADLQKLVGILLGRGHSDDDVAAILHGNWERLLSDVLP